MKNKKILIFRQQLFKPSETFITAQAENLVDYTPIYVGRKEYGEAPKNSETVLLADPSLLNQIKYVCSRSPKKEVVSKFKDNIELIHAHFAIDGVYAMKLAKELDVPLIVTLHGFDVTRSLKDMLLDFKPSFYNYFINRKELFEKADKFICVSDFIRQKAIEAGFPENKLITHYIGIDVEQFSFREKLPDDQIILHVARLVEKKGTTYLLKALAQVRENIPNVKLVIIGDGPLRSKLEDEAKSLDLEENVEFLGVQPNTVVKKWLDKASLMCVPSIVADNGDAEGLGIVNLEAAAKGVPVVAFASGGIVEAVVDGVTGYLVPEKNIKLLSKRMVEILSNKELQVKLGKQSRDYVVLKHNQRKQNIKLEDLYKEIVNL
jgi:colanic acid/amylovoran biosynthesis glycosyltransferase